MQCVQRPAKELEVHRQQNKLWQKWDERCGGKEQVNCKNERDDLFVIRASVACVFQTTLAEMSNSDYFQNIHPQSDWMESAGGAKERGGRGRLTSGLLRQRSSRSPSDTFNCVSPRCCWDMAKPISICNSVVDPPTTRTRTANHACVHNTNQDNIKI